MSVKEKDAIGWVCLSLTVCKRETVLACVCVCVLCVLCVSGVVRLLMLRGNHVSGSVISDSDSELEAERQKQTQLSSGGHNYGAGIETLKNPFP